MTVFCSRIVDSNLGDQICCPSDYVRLGDDVRKISIWDYKHGPVIFGGGGLLHPGVDDMLEEALTADGRPKIIWGIGTNYHGLKEPYYPSWLGKFDLVGLRDWGNVYEYVPCPSCLHPEFDKPRGVVTEEFVIYEHHNQPIQIPGTFFRRATNSQAADAFPAVLDFLSSADCVITNTYHGLYWSMLLGKKSICWKPYSNRFRTFKYPVPSCQEDNWKERSKEAIVATGYLEECRALNLAFHEKVLGVLGSVIEGQRC